MKLIDLDCIKNHEDAFLVWEWVHKSMRVKRSEDGPIIEKSEAIYYVTTKDVPDLHGLPAILEIMHDKTLSLIIEKMIKEINKVAEKHGIEPTNKFKNMMGNRHTIVTNREMKKLRNYGITPINLDMLPSLIPSRGNWRH